MAVKVIDGTTVTFDDTKLNQARFPQNPSQKESLGFPIALMVVIQSLVTGMIESMAFDPTSGKETGVVVAALRVSQQTAKRLGQSSCKRPVYEPAQTSRRYLV